MIVVNNGYRFHKMSDTGYWYNRTVGLLHRYVWEQHNNLTVPEGYVLHHKDENKDNNDITNLQLITRGQHTAMHNVGSARHITPHTDETKAKIKAKRAEQIMPKWNDERRERHANTIADKYPQQMIDDAKVLGRKAYMEKYSVGRRVYDRLRTK